MYDYHKILIEDLNKCRNLHKTYIINKDIVRAIRIKVKASAIIELIRLERAKS